MTSYESVLELIVDVPSAASGDIRDITWVTKAHVIGVSRDCHGRVEIFLEGAELRPASKSVGDAIEFRSWHRKNVASFEANKLQFPALGHFDQIAAFICTELLRNGADETLSDAFAKTEPIIEMAIERLRMSNEVVLGLAGELLMLDALCRRSNGDQVARAVESWHGWGKSARDFAWGTTGVEVKTTMRSTSSHLVQGVHQVEPNDGADGGVPEDRLYVVSIGLQPADAGSNSFSIPQLVQRIIERMDATGCGENRGKFLSRILEYGVESGGGYDHHTMAADPSYASFFRTSFFRAYDMSDEAVEVLRRSDLAVRHHVDVSSVRFRIDLPVIAGYGNPVSGANQVADVVFGDVS